MNRPQCAHALDEAPAATGAAAAAAAGASDAWGRGGYAVLFSLNGTLSLAVQTLVQICAASSRMNTRQQFNMLAGYAALVAVVTAGWGVAVRQRTGAWRLTHSGERGGAGVGGGGGGGGRGYISLEGDSGGDVPMQGVSGDDDDADWRIGGTAGAGGGGGGTKAQSVGGDGASRGRLS